MRDSPKSTGDKSSRKDAIKNVARQNKVNFVNDLKSLEKMVRSGVCPAIRW